MYKDLILFTEDKDAAIIKGFVANYIDCVDR